MTRHFIACHKFELDLVFKVIRVTDSLIFGTLEGGTTCRLWVWKIFIITVDTSTKDLPKLHQLDLFNLCQDHSSNRHFQTNTQNKVAASSWVGFMPQS